MSKDNKTIYVILGLLNHQDLTGYDIKKRIDVSLSFFWNAGFGQIYPTLKKMEESGLVIKKKKAKEGRNKIIYSITKEGTEELKQWLSVPVEKEYIKYEILLKLFFGSVIDREKNIDLIENFKTRNLEGLNILSMYKSQLSKILELDTQSSGPESIKPIMTTIMFMVAAISATLTPIFKQLSLFLGTVKDDRPFAPENSKRLTTIGVVLIIGAFIVRIAEAFVATMIVDKLKLDNISVNYSADSNMILMGFMVLILAGVFKYGSYLQRQYDSTV